MALIFFRDLKFIIVQFFILFFKPVEFCSDMFLLPLGVPPIHSIDQGSDTYLRNPRPDPPPTRTEPELTSTVTASRPWFCFNYAFDSFQTFVMSASLSFSFWSSPRLTRRQRSFTWRGQKGNYFLSEKEKKRRKEHREYLRLDKLCVFEDVSSQSWWHRCPQRRLLKKMVHSGQNIRGDKDLLRYIR